MFFINCHLLFVVDVLNVLLQYHFPIHWQQTTRKKKQLRLYYILAQGVYNKNLIVVKENSSYDFSILMPFKKKITLIGHIF